MTQSGLHLDRLQRSFPGFDLGPLSLDLAPGQVHGLLGPNGAGKTTLLNLITVQIRSTAGEMSYNGTAIRWGDPGWKARLSFIRETPAFYDELTIAETLRLAGRFYDQWDEQFAWTLLDRFRLPRAQRVGTLSKGTKVKVGLVAALAHRAELLVLDEPTAGLDPTARADLQQTLRELVRDRADLCLLLSSHIFEDLEQVADNVVVLRNGNVVFKASRAELGDLVLYRLPSGVELETSADMPLAWRKNGSLWVFVRRASDLNERLRSRHDCVEERIVNPLATVYHGTEHLCASDTSPR